MTIHRQRTYGKSADRRAIESFAVFLTSNILLHLNIWALNFISFATCSNFRFGFVRLFIRDYRIQPRNPTITIQRNLITFVSPCRIYFLKIKSKTHLGSNLCAN